MTAQDDFIDEVTASERRDVIHLEFDDDEAHTGLGPAVVLTWKTLAVGIVPTAQSDEKGDRFFLDVFTFVEGEGTEMESLAWNLKGGEPT